MLYQKTLTFLNLQASSQILPTAESSKSPATIPPRAKGRRCSRSGAQVGDDSHLPHVHGGAGHVCGWVPGQPNDINFFPSPCWLRSPQLGARARQQLPPRHTPLPVPWLRQPLPQRLCHVRLKRHEWAALWHQAWSFCGNSSKQVHHSQRAVRRLQNAIVSKAGNKTEN